MAQPPAYTRQFDFTDYQTSNPADPLPGDEVDGEFNAVKTTLDAVRTNLALIQRDDGEIANDVVTPDSFTAASLALIAGDWTPRGAWVTLTVYAAYDMVSEGGASYVCLTAHTAGTFATDLAAGKWQALGALQSDADDIEVVPAGNIASTNVQDALEELDDEKQPLDTDLTAIAALTSAADKIPYATGAGTWALADFTSKGRDIVDSASALEARQALEIDGSSAKIASGDIAGGAVTLVKTHRDTSAGSGSLVFGRSLISGVLVPTVASGALTIAMKNRIPASFANDPSAADPVTYLCRSAIANTSTTYQVKNITAAMSLVVPSTATMGATSGVQFRLWIVVFHTAAGGDELGVINCRNGTDIYPLGRIASATSVAITTGADSAHVIYTTSTQTARPYAILGYMEWSSGLATAGTWDTLPDIVEGFGPHTLLPGADVQRVRASLGTVFETGNTATPIDTSVPGIAEGNNLDGLEKSITPTSVCNLIHVRGQFQLSATSGAVAAAVALHAGGDALAVSTWKPQGNDADEHPAHLDHVFVAGQTTAIDFTVRVGANSGQVFTLNGVNGTVRFGGVGNSFLEAREIMT